MGCWTSGSLASETTKDLHVKEATDRQLGQWLFAEKLSQHTQPICYQGHKHVEQRRYSLGCSIWSRVEEQVNPHLPHMAHGPLSAGHFRLCIQQVLSLWISGIVGWGGGV